MISPTFSDNDVPLNYRPQTKAIKISKYKQAYTQTMNTENE